MKLDPTGQAHGPAAFFGDAVGRRVGSPATGWENAVLKAYGIEPTRHNRTHGLAPETRAALQAIDLHFHDLRHEAGSRMLEAGWPLHHIQRMLGHANLSQTSTYLNAQRGGLQDSMQRFGTTPLHAVAPEAHGEQSPPSNETPTVDAKPVIN